MSNKNPLHLPRLPIDFTKLTPDDIKRHLERLKFKSKARTEFRESLAAYKIAKAMGQKFTPPPIS